jgi:transcriptional regulator with XRE-family HTH domain
MIGEHIRYLREEKGILLKELASELSIDTAVLSKIERGERVFKKDNIRMLSKIFNQNEKNLLSLWLADKILKTTRNEKYKIEALKLAIESCNGQTKS